jgi:D-mannonate dehydratase
MNNFQSSEVVIISRDQIKNAPYNPRKISDFAAKQLKKNIKKNGLMGGIVVNKTTMHIVSGHQRVSALDDLNKGIEYDIRVEMVELDEKTEKEQNLFMNSTTVQGTFDLHKVRAILETVDVEACGFDAADFQIIGYSAYEPPPKAKSNENELSRIEDNTVHDNAQLQYEKEERKQEIKDLKQNIQNKAQEQLQTEPYVVLSWNDVEDKQLFMSKLGFDENENMLDGRAFLMRINELFGIKL